MLKSLLYPTLLLLLCSPFVYADVELKVTQARVMVAPPGVSVTAGLMTIVNDSASDIDIISISALGFERVEMHKTEVVDGVARMRHERQVTVPAKSTLVLEHGGYHLMLYAPARSFAEGDNVEMTLTTSEGALTVSVPVRRHGSN